MDLHVYYSDLDLLRVTWGRVITEDSLRTHFELLKASSHYPRHLKIVTSTDVEELGFSLTEENMLRIRSWREAALDEYETVMTAFYKLQPVPSAYVSYFSSFFDSPKSLMREFENEDSALRWLMSSQVGY